MSVELPEGAKAQDCAASYDCWFRAKVQAAMDDHSPGIPHEHVMREMEALIAAKSRKHHPD